MSGEDAYFRLRRAVPRPDGSRYFGAWAGAVDDPTGLFRDRDAAEHARDALPDAAAWEVHTRAECRRLDLEAPEAAGRP